MVRSLLEKIFDIREGELFRALSMQINIFLIITTLLILKPTVNSLFLSTYGIQSLPNAFILVAIVAGIITMLYSKIVQRIRFFYLFNGTLVSSVLILLFFGFALRAGLWSAGLMYLFYIWVAIFAVLTTSQFWLLVNMVFDVREIKRLIGFIGAGAIAGGIFGGYLTSFLTQYISSVNLPFVGAFFIALCLPLTILIFHRSKGVEMVTKTERKKKGKARPFKMILQSKHLTYLAAIVAVSNVVAKLVDYQFSDVASQLITDQEELTSFFGFWFSTFNVAALVIQLVATRYVVNRFGVGLSLLLLPTIIALSVILLIVAPELLLAVILMKMADGSLKQSVNKSAMELLVLPISIDIKNQTKTFIDVFVDSLATGLSGMILIFVVKGLSLSTTTISFIILAFIVGWIYLILNIRKEYLYSFKMKILNNVQAKHQPIGKVGRSMIFKDIEATFVKGTEKQIITALQHIKIIKDKRIHQLVEGLLEHNSAAIRKEALQYLSYFKSKTVYQKVQKMTSDKDTRVKMAAFAYLVEHGRKKNKEIINQHLENADEVLSGPALISLAIEIQNNPKLKRRYELKERIVKKLRSIPEIPELKKRYLQKVYCIQAIGHARIPELYPDLLDFFNDRNPTIVRQAILAAGKTKDEYFLRQLIDFSLNPTYARMAYKSIRQYEDRVIPILHDFLKKYPEDIKYIRKYPAIVKKIGSQKAIRFLFQLLEYPDQNVRQKALEGLSDLHSNFSSLRFKKKKVSLQILEEVLRFQHSLVLAHVQMEQLKEDVSEIIPARKRVISLLRKSLGNKLENIFYLLSLRYSKDNLSAILRGLKSRKPKVKVTALEFLDNLLEPSLKRILIPVFEVGILDIAHRHDINKLRLEFPDEYGGIQAMLNSGKDIRLKIATLHLVSQLEDFRYVPLVEDCLKFSDPELKLYAGEVLKKLNKSTQESV